MKNCHENIFLLGVYDLLLLYVFCPYLFWWHNSFFFRPFISDKTDLESTHSSNMSGLPEKQIIPPDALYSSNEKIMNMRNSGYISYEAVFNDSKVSYIIYILESLFIRYYIGKGFLKISLFKSLMKKEHYNCSMWENNISLARNVFSSIQE